MSWLIFIHGLVFSCRIPLLYLWVVAGVVEGTMTWVTLTKFWFFFFFAVFFLDGVKR